MKSPEIDAIVNQLIKELPSEGFLFDGFLYEKDDELLNIDRKSGHLMYTKKTDTEKFGILNTHFDLHFSQILRVPKPLLKFLRDKAEEELLIFIKKDAEKTKNSNISFL